MRYQFSFSSHMRREVRYDPVAKLFFGSRVSWARTYFTEASLLDSVKRGTIIITERGKKTLIKKPNKINNKLLREFPEFIEFQSPKSDEAKESITILLDVPKIETPEELLKSGYIKLRKSPEQEILSKLKSVHPSFFERIVVELLVKMVYGGSIQDAVKVIGKSGDEGIDGIIKEDKLELDVIYIQAKRWERVIGRPEVQKFVGVIAGQRAKKGVFITTSNFTKKAVDYVRQIDTKIVLIDGQKLSQYMIDYNLGVFVQNVYEIKKIDSDYFEAE